MQQLPWATLVFNVILCQFFQGGGALPHGHAPVDRFSDLSPTGVGLGYRFVIHHVDTSCLHERNRINQVRRVLPKSGTVWFAVPCSSWVFMCWPEAFQCARFVFWLLLAKCFESFNAISFADILIGIF